MGNTIVELITAYPEKKSHIISKVKGKLLEDSVSDKIKSKDPLRVGTLIQMSKMNNEQMAHVYI